MVGVLPAFKIYAACYMKFFLHQFLFHCYHKWRTSSASPLHIIEKLRHPGSMSDLLNSIHPGIPSITQNKVVRAKNKVSARQCKPVHSLSLFCAPMHLCTHALHEMARERGDLISSGMILSRVVGGS